MAGGTIDIPAVFDSSGLIAFEWQQSHKTSSLNRLGHGVLADRGATSFTTSHDLAVAIDQFLEQFYVFVVDIHWAWPFAIYVQRIFPSRTCFRFRLATIRLSSHFRQWTSSLF